METVGNAHCPFCSLFCSLQAAPGCSFGGVGLPRCILAEKCYRELNKPTAPPQIWGEPVVLSQAVQRVRSLLYEARLPLVVISGGLSCEEQTAALALARQYHAVVDTPASAGGCAVALGRRRSGYLTATLGELAGGFDLAVTWDCSPEDSHPRLWECLGGNQSSVKIVHIEEKHVEEFCETESGFSIPAGNTVESLHRIRMAMKSPYPDTPEGRFVAQLLRAQRGLLVLGPGQAADNVHSVAERMTFFDMLGRGDRWFSLQLTNEPNDTGAVEMIASLTGYPGSLHFDANPLVGANHVTWSPWDWDGENLLRRGETDLALFLGVCPPLEHSEATAIVQIGGEASAISPQVYIPAGRVGVTSPGTCLRLDGVPVWLERLVDVGLPEIPDLLKMLTCEVAQ